MSESLKTDTITKGIIRRLKAAMHKVNLTLLSFVNLVQVEGFAKVLD